MAQRVQKLSKKYKNVKSARREAFRRKKNLNRWKKNKGVRK